MTEREEAAFVLCVACLGAFSSKELGGVLINALPPAGTAVEELVRDRIKTLVAGVDGALAIAAELGIKPSYSSEH